MLSTFSRVFENIVHDQLHEFLKANGILTNNQCAFWRLYSTIMEHARFKDPWPKIWLSVMNLICFDRCVMVYKIVNKQCPESLWNMFQQRCSISHYNTRNYRDLHIPKLNLEITKKRFHYWGIKAWNDILGNIKELPSLCLFKIHLRRHLMSTDNTSKPNFLLGVATIYII